MSAHKVGSREEHLEARLELLAAEKEFTRRGDDGEKRLSDTDADESAGILRPVRQMYITEALFVYTLVCGCCDQ